MPAFTVIVEIAMLLFPSSAVYCYLQLHFHNQLRQSEWILPKGTNINYKNERFLYDNDKKKKTLQVPTAVTKYISVSK